MSVSYPQNLKTTFKKFEQFMKFCSFFQIVFSFFFYTVKADWGGPCPSPFLKEDKNFPHPEDIVRAVKRVLNK